MRSSQLFILRIIVVVNQVHVLVLVQGIDASIHKGRGVWKSQTSLSVLAVALFSEQPLLFLLEDCYPIVVKT